MERLPYTLRTFSASRFNGGQNNLDLKENRKKFFYQNKNDEKDPILWSYNSIWYGRATQQFKQIPKNLKEDIESIKDAETLETKKVLSP